jgi:hypothetical protein
MRTLELDNVFVVNGRLVIRLITFAKLLHYSEIYLLQLIKKLLKKGIKIAFKWKRNWYIILPTTPIKSIVQNKNNNSRDSADTVENAVTPSGDSINTDWGAAIDELPPAVNTALGRTNFTVTIVNDRLVIPTPLTQLLSSTLTPKNGTQFVPSNLGLFPAMTDYKYGYYIIYNENKMSTFDPGTSGTLKSTQIPQAFFEVCRALDAAENSRNGANPGLPARRNLSTTVSFDTGTIAVAASIPIVTSIQTDGTIKILASDYLGSAYSTFANGGGDLTSTNIVAAFLETASLLSASEKAVTPIENQPNNIQIQVDVEAGSATVSGNIPFTTAAATNGDVTIKAIDYL